MRVPKEMVGSGTHGTAPVGVTSSDERLSFDDDVEAVANRIGLSLGQRAAVSDLVTDVVDRVLALPVPSSDEPEGEWRVTAIRDVIVECGGPDIVGNARAVAYAIHRRLAALAPVSVGDAEPVAWEIVWQDDIDPPVREVTLDADRAGVAAQWGKKTIALYRLPVSSQDAGWQAADLSDAEHRAIDEVLDAAGVRQLNDENVPIGGALRVGALAEDRDMWRGMAESQERAVDLVLPAEGERRGELIEVIAKAMSEVGGVQLPCDHAGVYDDLRTAAAGKAGSDDAR